MITIAIITARGGSKRIPRKNIKDFLGKPIIAYSIQSAIESGLFDRIIVSTDDEEIAEIARNYGAETPFLRPSDLADDHTGTMPVVRHAIQWLIENGESLVYACCIYPTAPFLTAQTLIDGFEILNRQDKAFVFSASRFRYPIQRALKRTENGGIEPFFPEFMPSRSQDLEPAYHDAGQFYWGKVDAFLGSKSVFGEDSLPMLLPQHTVQDIDDEEDWVRAEFMYRAQRLA